MDYKKHYDQLILTRLKLKDKRIKLKQNKIQYFEGHHIIPKSLGGEGKSYNFNHYNIVLLTAREHFIAHWLLTKIDPCIQNIRSFWKMCINKNTPEKYCSSKGYEEARVLFAYSMKGNQYALGNKTRKSNTENMKWTDEKRVKYRNATLGKHKVGNYKGNKFFLNKKRPDISKVKSKKIFDIQKNLIYLSKNECIKKLNIKNNYQFYKKINNNELNFI